MPAPEAINSSSFTQQIIKNIVNTSSACPPFKVKQKSNLIGLNDSKTAHLTQQKLMNSAISSPRSGKNNLNLVAWKINVI